jgi:hypothetical protein
MDSWLTFSISNDSFPVTHGVRWLYTGSSKLKGNLMKIQDCPAAVNGTNVTIEHWVDLTWEAVTSRNAKVAHRPSRQP